MRPRLHVAVPGALDQRTGGYIYDRKIVDGLRALGWPIEVHELQGRFPDPDDVAIRAAASAADVMTTGGVPLIDGLALLAFEPRIEHLPGPWIGLIHHPLSMETGLSPSASARLAAREGRLMRQAGGLIVTSPQTKRDLAAFDIDPASVTVVEPGIVPSGLAAGGGKAGVPALLCVGSLTRRKGYPILLQALARLIDLDWRLTMVGSDRWDADHAVEIRQAITDLGLGDRVRLIGEQDEAGLAAQYHQADLFVLASHHEGYGMVLAEALARGLPIVSTTAGAIPDTVPDGAGRLVPPGDAGAFAAEVRTLLTDKQQYRRLKQGAEKARTNLQDWQSAAARFGRAIEEVRAI